VNPPNFTVRPARVRRPSRLPQAQGHGAMPVAGRDSVRRTLCAATGVTLDAGGHKLMALGVFFVSQEDA
jgi:hypothetical protein